MRAGTDSNNHKEKRALTKLDQKPQCIFKLTTKNGANILKVCQTLFRSMFIIINNIELKNHSCNKKKIKKGVLEIY